MESPEALPIRVPGKFSMQEIWPEAKGPIQNVDRPFRANFVLLQSRLGQLNGAVNAGTARSSRSGCRFRQGTEINTGRLRFSADVIYCERAGTTPIAGRGACRSRSSSDAGVHVPFCDHVGTACSATRSSSNKQPVCGPVV